jgi:hypothetical protein
VLSNNYEKDKLVFTPTAGAQRRIRGASISKFILGLMLLTLVICPLLASRKALVIGNSAYTASPLKNPVNDARAMEKVLRDLGFDVTVGYDVRDYREMLRLIQDFGEGLDEESVGLFYYAGHGIQNNGRNYLIPTDADIRRDRDIPLQGVLLDEVLAEMDNAQNEINIVILDACRNNPFATSLRSAKRGLAATTEKIPGLLIAYATAPDGVAQDGTGDNGIYTEELMKNMKIPGLSLTQILMQTREGVMKRTDREQIPWDNSSLIREFYFSTAPKETPPVVLTEETQVQTIRNYGSIVVSSIQDADVYLDGSFKGKVSAAADLVINNVTVGSHSLEARSPHRSESKSLYVNKNQESAVYFGQTPDEIVVHFAPEDLGVKQVPINEVVRVSSSDPKLIHLDTNMCLWRDEVNLYVRWEAKIDDNFNPGKYNNRDESDECDYLSLQLITGPNNNYAYYYQALPCGNKYDGIRRSDMSIDLAWNSNYSYTNTITDNLWTCQMTIPFKDLRYSGKPPYKWKLIVTRYLSHQEHFYSYPAVTTNMGLDYFRSAADITIDERPQRSLKPYIDAYVLGRLAPQLIGSSSSNNSVGATGIEAGFDSSISFSPVANIQYSMNPDFSDVPLDIDDYRYTPDYWPVCPENRPFFVDEIDVFDLHSKPFYTRNIHQPLFATTFTRASNLLSYGLFFAHDRSKEYDENPFFEDQTHTIDSKTHTIFSAKAKWEKHSLLLSYKDWQYLRIKPIIYLYKNNFVWLDYDSETGKLPSRAGAELNISDLKIETKYNNRTQYYPTYIKIPTLSNFREFKTTATFSRTHSSELIKQYQIVFWYDHIAHTVYDLNLAHYGGSIQASFPFKLDISIGYCGGDMTSKPSASLHFYLLEWLRPKLVITENYRFYTEELKYDDDDDDDDKDWQTYRKDHYLNKHTRSISVSGVLSKHLAYLLSYDSYQYWIDNYESSWSDTGEWKNWYNDYAERYRLGLKINFSNTLSISPNIYYQKRKANDGGVNYFRPSEIKAFFDFNWEFKKDCFLRVGARDSFGFHPSEPYLYLKANYSF